MIYPQVRVPLNTACECRGVPRCTGAKFFSVLAVQNMVACNAVSKTHEVEFKALESSLNMMSKGV